MEILLRKFCRIGALSLLLMAPVVIAGCQSAKDSATRFGSRNFARVAMNKPYEQVAVMPAFGETNIFQIGKSTAYGPMIGSFQLANGDTVYRHMKPHETSTSSSDFGLIRTSKKSEFTLYLGYFRVNSEGKVVDWAAATVPGGEQKCVGYIGGIIGNCSDVGARDESLAFYDNLVQTSQNLPISCWGPRAGVATSPAVAAVQ